MWEEAEVEREMQVEVEEAKFYRVEWSACECLNFELCTIWQTRCGGRGFMSGMDGVGIWVGSYSYTGCGNPI